MKDALKAQVHTAIVGVLFLCSLAAYAALAATGHDAAAAQLKDLTYLLGGTAGGVAGTTAAVRTIGQNGGGS